MSIDHRSDEPTLSIKQACDLAGVSRRTIYNWIDRDKVRYRRNAGGAIRIFRDSLFQPEKVTAAK